jgi:hypothetical protein
MMIASAIEEPVLAATDDEQREQEDADHDRRQAVQHVERQLDPAGDPAMRSPCPHCDNALARIVRDDARLWVAFPGVRTLEVAI